MPVIVMSEERLASSKKSIHFCRDVHASKVKIHHFFTFALPMGYFGLESPPSILTLFGFSLGNTIITARQQYEGQSSLHTASRW